MLLPPPCRDARADDASAQRRRHHRCLLRPLLYSQRAILGVTVDHSVVHDPRDGRRSIGPPGTARHRSTMSTRFDGGGEPDQGPSSSGSILEPSRRASTSSGSASSSSRSSHSPLSAEFLFHCVFVLLVLHAFLFGLRGTLLRIGLVSVPLLLYADARAFGLDMPPLELTEWPLMFVIAALVAWMAEKRASTSRRYATLFRSASERLLTVEEDERRRIAGELHDGVGQVLTALTLTLDAAGAETDASDRSPACRLRSNARRCCAGGDARPLAPDPPDPPRGARTGRCGPGPGVAVRVPGRRRGRRRRRRSRACSVRRRPWRSIASSRRPWRTRLATVALRVPSCRSRKRTSA